MPRLSTLLLLDSETKGRETLTYGFEGSGVKVLAASGVAEARQFLTNGEAAQVALVVLREPFEDALEFLQEQRTLRNGSGPALLALGPEALAPEIHALPGVDFLALPAFVRDTITAGKLLAASAPLGEEPGARELQGALSDYGMFFIVRTMASLGRSGVVTLDRANRKGEVRFSEGEVIAAQVGSLQGPPALHQLLLWEEAALDVKMRSVAKRAHTFKKGEDLLEETERFLRDFSHATKSLGSVQSLYVHDAERAAQAIDAIPVEVVPVLRLFDGQRTLGDVLEDSPFRVFDTIRIAVRLLETGAIRRKAIEKPSAAATRRSQQEQTAARGATNATPAPAPETAPAGPADDQRTGAGNRRKAPRREKTTADLGTVAPRTEKTKPATARPSSRGPSPTVAAAAVPAPAPTTAAVPTPAPVAAPPGHPASPAPASMAVPAAVVAAPVAVQPAAPVAVLPPAAVSASTAPVPGPAAPTSPIGSAEARSGELQARGEIRASRREMPAISADVPSVVIDLGAPIPAPAGPSGPSVVPAAALPGGPGPDSAVPFRTPTPASGVIRVGALQPPRAEAPPRPGGGSSIQIDPDLAAEMDAFELANTPPTPPPTVTAGPPPAVSSSAAPTVPFGAPQPAPSPPSPPATPAPNPPSPPATPAPNSVISFVRGGPTPPPASRTPGLGLPTPPPATPVVPSAPASPPAPITAAPPAPAPAAPAPEAASAARSKRGPSGEFNALEADFFAREADLYKNDGDETFDDLDGYRPGGRRR